MKSFPSVAACLFFPNSHLIVDGDFNCYDSHLVKLGAPVIDINLAIRFKDAWHSLHPQVKAFTWYSLDLSIASGPDTFMVSWSLTGQIESCDIAPCLFGPRFCYLKVCFN